MTKETICAKEIPLGGGGGGGAGISVVTMGPPKHYNDNTTGTLMMNN